MREKVGRTWIKLIGHALLRDACLVENTARLSRRGNRRNASGGAPHLTTAICIMYTACKFNCVQRAAGLQLACKCENFPRKIPNSLSGSVPIRGRCVNLNSSSRFRETRHDGSSIANHRHRHPSPDFQRTLCLLARPCSFFDRLSSTTPVDSTAKRRKTSGNPYAVDGQRATGIAGACASPMTSPTHIRARIRRVVLDMALGRYLHSPFIVATDER
ncbi:hypothetical protein HN011_000654 [Eciton burchellii]|nr:hypothetical protein HN011_000654 [Eciton burchellii]